MGCEVQIHEKTDKRGTWSYHSLDGWYLSMSPEHYRVHNCYVKTTQAERLTDTIQFKHKNITNPTISAHDKIMQALANCTATLKGMMNENPTQKMEELQSIVNNARAYLSNERKPTRIKFRGWSRGKFRGWTPMSPNRHHHAHRIPTPQTE